MFDNFVYGFELSNNDLLFDLDIENRMKKILTVVVPTYNMEKYLDKCLTSLIIEDIELLKRIEVLVIIDGATDRSSEIAHTYQDSYPDTFRVVDKENGNYGSCINRGLKEATGKYIKILDADDWFDTKAFHKYIETIIDIDCDLILNNCDVVDEQEDVTRSFDIDFIETNKYVGFDQIQNSCLVNLQMHCAAYRTELIRNIGYNQDEGISYTDQEWMCYPLSAVKIMYSTGITLYKYLFGRVGQTMNIDILNKKFNDEVAICMTMIRWCEQDNDYLVDKVFLKAKMMSRILFLHRNHILKNMYDKKEFAMFSKWLKNNSYSIYKGIENEIIDEGEPFKYIWFYHVFAIRHIPTIIHRINGVRVRCNNVRKNNHLIKGVIVC